MDPGLLHGFGIIVPDPDPAKNERADKLKLLGFTAAVAAAIFLILGL